MSTSFEGATAPRLDPATSPELDHFIQLALAGEIRSAGSSGELAARALADTVIDHVPFLDDEAIAGLMQFISLTKLKPSTARELV